MDLERRELLVGLEDRELLVGLEDLLPQDHLALLAGLDRLEGLADQEGPVEY